MMLMLEEFVGYAIELQGSSRGGAAVLKVGGGQFCEKSEQKNFLTPHFLASGGDKILLR